MTELNRHIIKRDEVPEKFPTHLHDSAFWENLGRAIATFGLLEVTLTKAIFSFTATKPYSEEEVDEAYDKWLPKLERALKDPLRNLIEVYGKVVREHPDSTITNLNDLLEQLIAASIIRNVLCHGSWPPPDAAGKSIPFYVNSQLERFETPIDKEYLSQVQKHSVELIYTVIDTVTHMGWQFPGSNGPGKIIW